MLIAALLLVAAAGVLYTQTPALLLYSMYPFAVYGVLLAAVVAAYASRRRSVWRALTLGFTVMVATAFVGYTAVLSQLDRGVLAVQVGDSFPEVSLPTSTGATFSPADIKGQKPALYVLYRGAWCPFCRAELAELVRYYDRVQARGVELFAVSVDRPEQSEPLRRQLGAPFTFLSDEHGELLDRLNVRHGGGRVRDGGDVAYPTQILVDRNGVVRWTFESANYRVRARPDEIFAAIDDLD